MRVVLLGLLAFALSGCATMQVGDPTVSILVDLDPASTDRTVIVESITADRSGLLYLPDRVTGNILRVDPKSPKAVVVGSIEAREIEGKKVNADPSGIAFNSQGDLFVAVGPFREVVRIRGAELNPAKPGLAQTFATGTAGANGIAFDRQGNLFVGGGASGIVYRVGPNGGAAEAAVQIDKHVRTLPDGKTQQQIVANGVAFDTNGVLHVTDTARGAIWKVVIGPDGKGGKPVATGSESAARRCRRSGFRPQWHALGCSKMSLTLSLQLRRLDKCGRSQRTAAQGPLEFPSAIVFVGDRGYVSNFDTPRRDNMDANGLTARDGIGASIAQIAP